MLKEFIQDFSFIDAEDYKSIPIRRVHELAFELETEYGGLDDSQFDLLFNGADSIDFLENLSGVDEEVFENWFDASGHKIGGYAAFTQSDPRDYDSEKRNDWQLLK